MQPQNDSNRNANAARTGLLVVLALSGILSSTAPASALDEGSLLKGTPGILLPNRFGEFEDAIGLDEVIGLADDPTSIPLGCTARTQTVSRPQEDGTIARMNEASAKGALWPAVPGTYTRKWTVTVTFISNGVAGTPETNEYVSPGYLHLGTSPISSSIGGIAALGERSATEFHNYSYQVVFVYEVINEADWRLGYMTATCATYVTPPISG